MALNILGMLAVFFLLVLRPLVTALPPCPVIDGQLSPCIPYIEGRPVANPSIACCAGLKLTAGEIHGKQDLVSFCNCAKAGLTSLGKNVNASLVASLPKKCGVTIALPPIDKNYDCSKIAM